MDSTTAEAVVEILKDLAAEGRTIVCTIHQPSSEIFQKFDDLFLLANGSLTYSGPVAELPKFFKKQVCFPLPPLLHPPTPTIEFPLGTHLTNAFSNRDSLVRNTAIQQIT